MILFPKASGTVNAPPLITVPAGGGDDGTDVACGAADALEYGLALLSGRSCRESRISREKLRTADQTHDVVPECSKQNCPIGHTVGATREQVSCGSQRGLAGIDVVCAELHVHAALVPVSNRGRPIRCKLPLDRKHPLHLV